MPSYEKIILQDITKAVNCNFESFGIEQKKTVHDIQKMVQTNLKKQVIEVNNNRLQTIFRLKMRVK